MLNEKTGSAPFWANDNNPNLFLAQESPGTMWDNCVGIPRGDRFILFTNTNNLEEEVLSREGGIFFF